MPRIRPHTRSHMPSPRPGRSATSAIRGCVVVGLAGAVTLGCLPVAAAARSGVDRFEVAAAPGSEPPQTGQLVVKLAPGVDVEAINRRLGSTTRSTLLASRSIYLLDVPFATDETSPSKRDKAWAKQAKKTIADLRKNASVVYAETNHATDTAEDDRFHHWPSGGLTCGQGDLASYLTQPATGQLSLDAVHRRATGAGAVVAVLDTGIDLDHPWLESRIAPGGYDYVDDDATPGEVSDGLDQDGAGGVDDAYGHGSFVAGVVALVAPDARILPQRVLDSEGQGDVFTVAEAVFDATARGADVINMSFGMVDKVESKVLKEAFKAAQKKGVVVVAAAGNDGSGAEHYPAAVDGVVSVAALDADAVRLAPFSAHGKWVDLAAPGVDIISTVPCGYGTWTGTSMAAPFVAGAAALTVGAGGTSKQDKASEDVLKSGRDVKGLAVHDGVVDLRRLLKLT